MKEAKAKEDGGRGGSTDTRGLNGQRHLCMDGHGLSARCDWAVIRYLAELGCKGT